MPHAFGVWAHINRFLNQMAWVFGFQELEFLVRINRSLPFGGPVGSAMYCDIHKKNKRLKTESLVQSNYTPRNAEGSTGRQVSDP